MKTFLFEQIRQIVFDEKSNNWQGRFLSIVNTLNTLEPDKPEDGTPGFLAYNVPNKPRMKMKTGRFLTRKLHLNNGFLPDTVIQRIASMINASLFPDLSTRLDKGEAITENYYNQVGGRSCMTGSNADYTKLYERNPDRFQQLVIEQNGDSARAMVHKLDDGTYMMDCVYATCEYLKDQMKEYAKKQGWSIQGNGTISGLEYCDGEIPYMDTFNDYRIENGLLTIGTCLSDSHGTLDNTNGELENGTYCNSCERPYHEDNMIYINDEHYCESCVNEYFGYCEHCEEYYHNDDVVYIADREIYVCEYCVNRHYYRCEDCGDYISETILATVDGNKDVCTDCFDNYYRCEDCNEYTSEIIDGYCKDCLPKEIANCGGETGELFNEE